MHILKKSAKSLLLSTSPVITINNYKIVFAHLSKTGLTFFTAQLATKYVLNQNLAVKSFITYKFTVNVIMAILKVILHDININVLYLPHLRIFEFLHYQLFFICKY